MRAGATASAVAPAFLHLVPAMSARVQLTFKKMP